MKRSRILQTSLAKGGGGAGSDTAGAGSWRDDEAEHFSEVYVQFYMQSTKFPGIVISRRGGAVERVSALPAVPVSVIRGGLLGTAAPVVDSELSQEQAAGRLRWLKLGNTGDDAALVDAAQLTAWLCQRKAEAGGREDVAAAADFAAWLLSTHKEARGVSSSDIATAWRGWVLAGRPPVRAAAAAPATAAVAAGGAAGGTAASGGGGGAGSAGLGGSKPGIKRGREGRADGAGADGSGPGPSADAAAGRGAAGRAVGAAAAASAGGGGAAAGGGAPAPAPASLALVTRELVTCGLLIRRADVRGAGDAVESYWLGVPHGGPLSAQLGAGRAELLQRLGRRLHKECARAELLTQCLARSKLPMEWHIRDALGRGAAVQVATAAGAFVRVAR